MSEPVRWLGMNAVYAEPERAILAALPVREQAFLHTLKAFTEGELSEGGRCALICRSAPLVVTSAPPSPVYTEPEDIPFGDGAQTPRKRPTYALVWTWRRSRVFKTKRECIEKQRVWKKWYERQGWKVSSHDTGYFARHPSGQSHSISLHEYDPVTKERLR